MENKAAVTDHITFTQWLVRVERETGLWLTQIHNDGGSVYYNSLMGDVALTLGLLHSSTVNYTPEQDGVAQRLNRQLSQGILTTLAAAGLPRKLWPDALHYHCWVENRLVNKRGTCPY